MAQTPEAAMDLMMKVWRPAVSRVKDEVAEMQKIADGDQITIEPWDYRYYAEKVRKAKYDLDLSELAPYLHYENVKQAMFKMAKSLYQLNFTQIHNVAIFHDAVEVYRVTKDTGDLVGTIYFDSFQRSGKSSGAWMASYRDQSNLDGQRIYPVVSNNANYIAGDGTESAQLSWDDAVTMFHEFGHALHGLNSDVTYATLSGTATSMDHAELPSQFHEHYLMVREILRGLLDKNGHAMPDTLIDKLERAQSFNQGFLTVEYVSAAIVDMKLHQWQNFGEDITEFVDKTLKELDMPTQIVMRHRLAHFNHVFGSEGYASLYYGYLWSQVLDNDAFAAFTETGNPFDPATAERFYRYVLSRGNSLDTREGYIQFRGREATADALLKSRGFQ